MPGLSATTTPLIAPKQPYVADIGSAAQKARSSRFSEVQALAPALENLQSAVNYIQNALRQSPDVQDIIVRDTSGRVIAAIGEFETSGIQTSGGMFAELYAGFPFGISDPAQAIFRVKDGEVSVGQNGWMDVLDPFGGFAAWIGTKYDTSSVTGAVNNGSGLIRLTVTGHTLSTDDVVPVRNVGGLLDGFGENVAQGVFTVTKIDANHIDLQNSVFVGTYTSGGTVARLLHITGAANNGSGLIRLTTAVAHTYVTGDQVNVAAVGGVPNATGQWVVTVVNSTDIDLIGSTFAGGYTSGGTALRYFAGGLFETIAVAGTTFANAKFRALANGDLDITNALIKLIGGTATITLDPTDGSITVAANSPATMETRIDVGGVTVFSQAGTQPGLFLQNNSIILNSSVTYSGGIFSSGPGPQVTILKDEIAIQDAFGTINIDIKSDGSITTKGTVDAFKLNVNGLLMIDETHHAKNLASVDSVFYKVGGTAGLGLIDTFMRGITFNTRNDVVVGTPGAGQSNATVVTGVATVDTKTLTFDSGILLTEV